MGVLSFLLAGCEMFSSGPNNNGNDSSVEPSYFTVTWKNYNGDVLEIDTEVPYGTIPTYDGDNPTKPSTAEHFYSFASWSPTVEKVSGNAEYTATFNEEVRKYTITWKNYDGSVIKTEQIPYGTTPKYDGDDPTKPSTAECSYSFKNWSPALVPVIGDAEYTAQFTETTRKYTIKWVNYDGTILEIDECAYDETPHYDGVNPSKASIRGIDYSWAGWNPSPVPVCRDQVYTAIYSDIPFFSFDRVNYKYKKGYGASDVIGSPWANVNFQGEIYKIEKPSIKEDFYAAINYDDISNNALGPFEVNNSRISQTLDKMYFDSQVSTTNSAFLRAYYSKLSEGDIENVSSYLTSININNYMSSKALFSLPSSYLELIPEEDGYEIQFNDGFVDGDYSIQTLMFLTQFSNMTSLNNPMNNIINHLISKFGLPISSSGILNIKVLERSIINSAYNDHENEYGDSSTDYTVDTIPWSQIKLALLDAGLASNTKISIKDYCHNSLNSLFNIYLANNSAVVREALLLRLAFDYRFLLGKDNYLALATYLTNTGGYFANEAKLSNLKGGELYREMAKISISAVVEQCYIELEGDEDIKNRVSELIEKVLSGYNQIIGNEDWLSQETKAAVLKKLNAMNYYSCYSERYKNLSRIDETNLDSISGLELFNRYNDTYFCGHVNNPIVDDSLWVWKEQASFTCNAFYHHAYNSFAILNGAVPGFLGSGSDEELFGMLGFVIGHEITHAFDSKGAYFDENGISNDLMTESDRSLFNDKVNKLVKFYDNLTYFGTYSVGGSRVSGEAIADMGAVKVMLELAKNISDFDYDLFFRSVAKLWCCQPYPFTTGYANAILKDEHPMSYLRANVTLAQFDKFCETYDIGPGDGMYIPENQRVKIW